MSTGNVPEKTLYNFYPTEDFRLDEFNSEYMKGKRYHVREGNTKLHNIVQGLLSKGKVSLTPISE